MMQQTTLSLCDITDRSAADQFVICALCGYAQRQTVRCLKAMDTHRQEGLLQLSETGEVTPRHKLLSNLLLTRPDINGSSHLWSVDKELLVASILRRA